MANHTDAVGLNKESTIYIKCTGPHVSAFTLLMVVQSRQLVSPHSQHWECHLRLSMPLCLTHYLKGVKPTVSSV